MTTTETKPATDDMLAVAHGGPRPGRIFKAMLDVMAEVDPIEKGRQAPAGAGGYKFRGIDDVLATLQPVFKRHRVFLLPDVERVELREYPSKDGRPMQRTVVTMGFSFLAEDGSWVRARTIGEGADSGDKSCNKAMSGAMKYALVQTFAIPTEDPKDSENDHPVRGAPQGGSGGSGYGGPRSSAPANGPQGGPPRQFRGPRTS